MTDNIDTTPEAVEHLARKLMNLWAGGYGTTGKASNTIRALSARIEELEAERDDAMRQGLFLAKYLHQEHYSEVTNWEPLDDPAGVLSQIDNMIAGMSARIAELEVKLANAALLIEFLDENYRHAFGDKAREKIRAVYAEIKGETS